MDPHYLFEGVAAFIIGACIGSFLNVCIYRIPLDRSVVSPGSHCAMCGAPIPWYYNIPVLSWFILRGRAACCGTRIDARYWIVELSTGLLFAALWLKYPPLEAVIYAVMVSGLLVASMIDLDHYIIPDRFTLGGCLAGMIASAIDPKLQGTTTAMQGFSWSLASAIIGGLVLFGVAWFGTVLFRKEAMGMGDVKFIAAMCAFFGAISFMWILVVSSFIGAILGLALIFWRQGSWGTRIPYGPFLALAAVLWLFGGREITLDYLHSVTHTVKMTTSPIVDPKFINTEQ